MSKTVLLIEDDPDTQMGLKLRLEFSDYEVHIASDGVSAISLARTVKPDLILLDLGLPAGDGYVVMERLKALGGVSTVPIVVLTARVAATNKDRSIEAGASAFLTKPVDNAELVGTIDRLTGRNRMMV